MASGKCKKFTESFLAAQLIDGGRSRRQKKAKKRASEGRPSTSLAVSSDEAAEFLSEFPDMRLEDTVDTEPNRDSQLGREDEGEIQEIEDVGHLARELIARIQALRGQFRPGSQAALALPNIQMVEEMQSMMLNQPTESESASDTA